MTARKVLAALLCTGLLMTGVWGTDPILPPTVDCRFPFKEQDVQFYEGDHIPLEFAILPPMRF